ncbi:MAG: sugar phosphate isomerase/epimerase [Chloroflexi bacterium]|nr:sugar phosphate isomerase/epimerase [Chloroflexota bacterium]
MKRTFRLGSTSYVYPDDILPNVRQLAAQVDDIELVLFEVDDYGSNLPDAVVIAELNALARDNDLTYTVHLPIDLDWRDARSLDKICRAIDATHAPSPFAYVLHLDGRPLLGKPSHEILEQWQAETASALDKILERVEPTRLCVENIEKWPPEYFAPLVAAKNLSRCVDIGHLWVQQRDPVEHLQEHIARTRVIHLHGVGMRDHQSLAKQAKSEVVRVLDFLAQKNYVGVLTLEVFDLDDFSSSKRIVEEWANDSP